MLIKLENGDYVRANAVFGIRPMEPMERDAFAPEDYEPPSARVAVDWGDPKGAHFVSLVYCEDFAAARALADEIHGRIRRELDANHRVVADLIGLAAGRAEEMAARGSGEEVEPS